MTFVPAGHRFYGWQKSRALTRSTFLYIDPLSCLLSESEVDFRPRLIFFDPDGHCLGTTFREGTSRRGCMLPKRSPRRA
jgi:hypothetical protein